VRTNGKPTTTNGLEPLTPFFFETSPGTFPTDSPFFKLPRELRDEIYDYVLQGLTFNVDMQRAKYPMKFRYGTRSPANSKKRIDSRSAELRLLPRILLISKTFLSELLAAFYVNSSVELWEDYAEALNSPYALFTPPRIRVLDLGRLYIQLSYWDERAENWQED
jgi:hypothetical protein